MKPPMLILDPLMLRKLRKDRGHTQEVLAEKADVALRSVRQFEALADEADVDLAAREVDFRMSTINKLARALGVSGFSLLKEIRDP